MQDKEPELGHEERECLKTSPLSRRDFLKIAGAAGAAVGVGAGLGGVLAACGEEETTTTMAPETTTTMAPETTTTAAPTTTASTGPEMGRDILLGLVSPSTGPLALFAKADDWWVDYAMAAVSRWHHGRGRQARTRSRSSGPTANPTS